MSDRRVVQVFMSGRVQGVGYRDWTVGEARSRGLIGWVRNRRDGRVEAILAGPADVVAGMLETCRRGPPAARVDAVAATDLAASDEAGLEAVFRRLPTA